MGNYATCVSLTSGKCLPKSCTTYIRTYAMHVIHIDKVNNVCQWNVIHTDGRFIFFSQSYLGHHFSHHQHPIMLPLLHKSGLQVKSKAFWSKHLLYFLFHRRKMLSSSGLWVTPIFNPFQRKQTSSLFSLLKQMMH